MSDALLVVISLGLPVLVVVVWRLLAWRAARRDRILVGEWIYVDHGEETGFYRVTAVSRTGVSLDRDLEIKEP